MNLMQKNYTFSAPDQTDKHALFRQTRDGAAVEMNSDHNSAWEGLVCNAILCFSSATCPSPSILGGGKEGRLELEAIS